MHNFLEYGALPPLLTIALSVIFHAIPTA